MINNIPAENGMNTLSRLKVLLQNGIMIISNNAGIYEKNPRNPNSA
jgi:hypothetical protein